MENSKEYLYVVSHTKKLKKMDYIYLVVSKTKEEDSYFCPLYFNNVLKVIPCDNARELLKLLLNTINKNYGAFGDLFANDLPEYDIEYSIYVKINMVFQTLERIMHI